MGSNFATDLAGMKDMSLDDAIGIHLQGNHYPPVPLSMVQPCIDAINAYWEDDSNRLIELPEATSWRGKDKAPAWAIIEGHNLGAWCSSDEYEE